MKKLYLVLLICFLGSGMVFSQATYGLKFGMNYSNFKQDVQDSEDKEDFVYKPGINVGFIVNIPLGKIFTLQPSLAFSGKGAWYDLDKWKSDDVVAVDGYQYISVKYLELPVNLAAGLDVGTGQFQLFVGPYIAVGIGGWLNADYTLTFKDGSSFEEDDRFDFIFKNKIKQEDWEDGKGYMKPLDYGVNFGFGYTISRFLFNIGYSMGLQNLATTIEDPDDDFNNDDKIFNRTATVSVAILLGK